MGTGDREMETVFLFHFVLFCRAPGRITPECLWAFHSVKNLCSSHKHLLNGQYGQPLAAELRYTPSKSSVLCDHTERSSSK